MAENITEVRLLSVPLEKDYIHTFYFTSPEAQLDYFLNLQHKPFTNLSYQRKDGFIRVPAQYDTILQYNYVMYKNAAYSQKWFFAFITDSKYVDDGRTDVYIETDVIQTWLSSCTIKPSFVEREHAASDTIGEHTVPEQLETGDYIINKKNKNASLLTFSMVMATTVDLNNKVDDKFEPAAGGMYNGIYSGLKYYLMTDTQANRAIKALAEAGQSDAIVSIFMAPSLYVDSLVPEGGTYSEVQHNLNVVRKDWVNTFGVSDTENYKPTDIDGYTPKNNKLFTYPYCYMLMTNNSGGSAIYKYELFNNPTDPDHCAFYLYGSITPGFSIYISPRYYNGVDINSLEGLTLGKYPICAWTTDVYTNWLTQNSVNIGISVGSAVVQTGLGVTSAILGAALAPATGGASLLAGSAILAGTGALAGGASSIASTVGEIYSHSLQPPQAEGNVNSGDVMFSAGTLTFTAYQMTIKKEFAKLIDDYFTMFGYKINRVKVPAVGHRENFWYVKTIDANIDGAIPPQDLQKIKDCYNRGITFWKNPAVIGNYQVSNKTTT